MPVILDKEYNPNFILRNRHLNTMYPYLFRKSFKPGYKRERFETSDGDFVDLDFIRSGNKRLVIICHGLEGSSDSQYMQHTVKHLQTSPWDILALNFRTCSGEMNRNLQMYHSGFTHDLHEVITMYEQYYDEIALVGFSLGGNVSLKYISDGLYPITNKLCSVVGISVPCDLEGCADTFLSMSNKLYDIRFLMTLKKKMELKSKMHPEISMSDWKFVKHMGDFDEYYTAPLHGFSGAKDYYQKSSSLQFLDKIKIPTLLINALDDPFLSQESLPLEMAKHNDNLYFLAPKFGGHVGFTTFAANNYWNEKKILSFINDPYMYNRS